MKATQTVNTSLDSEVRPTKSRRGHPRTLLTGVAQRPLTGVAAGTIGVFVVFAIAAASHGFLSLDGTASWLDQAAELGIVAVPVGLLMIAGEFDLSVASVIDAAALTVGICSGHFHIPLIISVLIALVLSAAVGVINGIVTTRTRVPSFIVTLATYFALGGGTLALTAAIAGTTTVPVNATGLLHAVFAGSPHQFNVSILWCLLVTALAGYVLRRTAFGNWIQATGGERSAARDAGVPTDRVKVILFVGSAVGAGLLGVVQAVEYSGAYVGQGQNFIFDAIIASVVGGVLLQGGYGSAVGVLLGAITYSIVEVGVQYTGWDSNLTQLFIGLLVLAAVLANTALRGAATGGRKRRRNA